MASGTIGRPSRLRTYLELVRFSHTIFALPFAIMAALVAARFGADQAPADGQAWPPWMRLCVGILACMVSGRTAAMAFNRLVDRTIDAANPRTAVRHLPRGVVGVGEVVLLIVGSCGVFIAATLLFLPNWLPLVLSVPVLAWLLGYSYAKRFTALAHIWLGTALGLAPVAAWIALRGQTLLRDPADILPAAILGIAVTAWVSGFDIIYATQDYEFDRRQGLHSLVVRWGPKNALGVAFIAHLLLWILLAVFGALAAFRLAYWLGLVVIGVLLLAEHLLARRRDTRSVNIAFFKLNGTISALFLGLVAVEVMFPWFRLQWADSLFR